MARLTDLDKTLKKLKSQLASERYDACEELIAAKESSPEVILALEEATQDENKDVVERARKALGAQVHRQMAIKMGSSPTPASSGIGSRPLIDELNPGDTMYAVGKVRRRLDQLFSGQDSTGLLVRTVDGTYYVVDEDQPGKTEIRGLIDKTIYHSVGGTSHYYVGLVTDSGVIGFWPIDLFPEKIPDLMLYQKVSADFVLSRIKELEELEILQQCPICHLIRPVDVPQCSNPECAVRLASVETSSQGSRAGIPSCLCGGSLGALAGFLLFLLVYAIARKLNAPPELNALLQEYRWVFPAILAVVGTYSLFFYLESAAQKHASDS